MGSGNVFLVEDDVPTLKAMARFLRLSGFSVFDFASANDFLSQHDVRTPGCAVFDVSLGDTNALDLHRDLANRGCRRPTIFITARADIPTSVQAMKSGAIDFLMKPLEARALIEAIHKAIKIDQHTRQEEQRLSEFMTCIASLTPRQHEVLTQVLAGRQSKEIAVDMKISEKTVKIHRSQVLAKMGFSTSIALIRALSPQNDFSEILRRASG